jgi:hypothetical protein
MSGQSLRRHSRVFGCLTNRFQKSRFSDTSPSLQPLYDITRGQNRLGGGPLSGIEMLLLFGVGDGSLYGHDLLGTPLPLLHPAQDFFLGTDGFGCRETPA